MDRTRTEPDLPAPRLRPGSDAPMVILAGQLSSEHDFAGLAEALCARGLQPLRMSEIDAAAADNVAAVVVRDLESPLCRYALRRAAAAGARTVLLMDGIVEWRNTFTNPRVGPDFLRPAPVELIACAGENDRRILESLGNRAIATGLPRLTTVVAALLPPDDNAPVLIATARTPAFDGEQRRRLLDALARLKAALSVRGVPVLWRLTGGLHHEIDVPNDEGPLSDALARCQAVLTTPSTLLLEAMLAGRPVGLIHPHATPLWPLAPVVWRDGHAAEARGQSACLGSGDACREVSLEEFIESAISPRATDLVSQEQCLRAMHAPAASDAPAAHEALAGAIAALIDSPRPACPPEPPPSLASLPDPLPAPACERPRVVLMVSCDASPIGGVMSWALRTARHFAADKSLGFDVRVLALLTDPAAAHPAASGEHPFDLNPDGLTSICSIDPYDDRHVIVETVAAALDRLKPDIVLPGFHDVCWMAAMQARSRGARTIAVAHSDEPYYADLMRFYDRWEVGVAVSSRCRAWMEPLLNGRPCETIPYSVPVTTAPREPNRDTTAPLQIAYIGRMVRMQKRIFDLLGVIDGLERRCVPFHFHMVGDGADLGDWTSQLRSRRLTSGRVTLHGRRDMQWVQRFLPTIDVSVLVSDFEGTSVTMLEGMAQGVVPVVTRIASGVAEWVTDGVNGVTVPIGAPDEMAARLAELAADQALLQRLGEASWQRICDHLSPDRIARAWQGIFRAALDAPFDQRPTDLGVRSMENWRWSKQWADDPAGARASCRRVLTQAGYRRIGDHAPGPASDAVIVSSCEDAPSDEQVAAWRARGVGVAQAPLLMLNTAQRVRALLQQAVDDGCSRIVLYGIGRHTRRMPLLFRSGLPIVGFADDRPPPGPNPTLYGLPVVALSEVEALHPDVILLSTDTFEQQMWQRCAPLRRRGVRIISVYTQFEDDDAPAPSPHRQPAAAGVA